MNLVVKPYDAAPNLWCVVDEDRHIVKYTNIYKFECELWRDKNQIIIPSTKHRKKKLYFEDIKDWDYSNIKDIHRSLPKGNKIYGILVYFTALNEKEKEYILSFKNTEILNVKLQYAPEIKYKCVAIYDKCIKC